MSGAVKAEKCIHCHKCRDKCSFLNKYGIDIGDTDRLRELAYHCFLCGRCTEVCPVGIDGREIILDMRRERAASEERADIEKRYRGLISEKRDYRFRNWKHVTEGSVFFPGCNFPSQYPKTSAAAVRLFAKHGIGTVYECCGKPLAELGFVDDEERIIEGIRNRLRDNNITEIITGCPNCRGFFGDRLGIKVTGIFEKLAELGEGRMIEGDIAIYLPCPDRSERKWIEEIQRFVDGEISFVDGPQCCGLGGSASAFEPEIAKGFTGDLKGQSTDGRLVTYCASCIGQFGRCGFRDIDHLLALVLGTNEKPDTLKSYINRVLTKVR